MQNQASNTGTAPKININHQTRLKRDSQWVNDLIQVIFRNTFHMILLVLCHLDSNWFSYLNCRFIVGLNAVKNKIYSDKMITRWLHEIILHGSNYCRLSYVFRILEHVIVLIGTDQIDVKFYVWEIVLFNWAAVNMLTA